MKKINNIEGIKGHLLFDIDNKPYIRIKDKNEDGFIDLDIIHSDLEVILTGEGKIVIEDETTGFIDHSDEVLGYE